MAHHPRTGTGSRSAAAIANLVRQRVQQRNEWLVHGQPQKSLRAWQDFYQFATVLVPAFWRYTPPTQSFLDQHFPVQYLNNDKWTQLKNPPTNNQKIQVTWMGHSTCLFQVDGATILTDPVFSERCAPTQWAGPQRFRSPPCTIAELCQQLQPSKIDVVVISHNHYDHLDWHSVREIHKLSPTTLFVVPLGLKEWFDRHVSQSATVHELDWDEHVDYSYSLTATASDDSKSETQPRTLRITSVPMRHWTSRRGFDRDATLWCGYSITTKAQNSSKSSSKILFPGDTAWFDDMTELVGDRYGPFDVAAIPIGAYEPRSFMKKSHIHVAEAIRMKEACRVVHAVPIHWGTFPLTVEPVMEPRELLLKKFDAEGSFDPWLIGDIRVFPTMERGK